MKPNLTPAQVLPHAAPMILIDELVDVDGQDIVAYVHLRPDSPFCQGGAVGAWVGVEYMAQTVGAWAGYRNHVDGVGVKIGFLLGARRYECAVPQFEVGDTLRVSAHCDIQDEQGLSSFRCQISRHDQTLATANITVFQPQDAAAFLGGENN
jgi:3-oxoacyl-[acyl-carrier-protein] synthase I